MENAKEGLDEAHKNVSLFDNLNSSLKPRKIAFKETVSASGTDFWTLLAYLYNKRQKTEI